MVFSEDGELGAVGWKGLHSLGRSGRLQRGVFGNYCKHAS